MKKLLTGTGAVVGALIVWAAVPAVAQEGPVEFASAEVFTEINATDGDAGFHLDVDGQDWKRVTVHGPDGTKIFDVRGSGPLGEHGLTGLMFESAEPPFDELSIEEFKDRFAEGTYTFRGWAVDGSRLVATGEFTHDFPDAPVVVTPSVDGVVSISDPLVQWEAVLPPAGSEIVLYEIIVSAADIDLGLDMTLGPEATSVLLPEEILVAGEDYKVEVLAKEASGNQTITEVPFTVVD